MVYFVYVNTSRFKVKYTCINVYRFVLMYLYMYSLVFNVPQIHLSLDANCRIEHICPCYENVAKLCSSSRPSNSQMGLRGWEKCSQ